MYQSNTQRDKTHISMLNTLIRLVKSSLFFATVNGFKERPIALTQQ